jgi:hypothetical protein
VFSPLAAGVAPGVVVAFVVGSAVLVVDVHRLPDVDPTGSAVIAIVGIAAIVVAVAGHLFSPVQMLAVVRATAPVWGWV